MIRITHLSALTSGIAPIIGLAVFCHMAQPATASAQNSGSGDSVPPRVSVTREQVTRFGIKIAEASMGVVRPTLRVPGEIQVNADRVAQVVPLASGIVRTVGKNLGDRVTSDEILAWIESDELAEAKMDFYAKAFEVACGDIELPRAKAVYENVARLVELLRRKQEPSEEDLDKLDACEMGAYRGQLLAAHASYRVAITIHGREMNLADKGTGSGQDFIAAETHLLQARANLLAALDTAIHETRRAYAEAVRARQVAEFGALAAEKKLRLKGADDEVVAALRALVPKTHGSQLWTSRDPDCKGECLHALGETLSRNDRFAWFPLRAPFDGTVIAKRILVGASLDGASEAFTVADLSTVWVDLAIGQAAVATVRKGAPVTIRLPDGVSVDSRIDFVSPIVDAGTRTALARAVLDNSSGIFRPGTFIEASVSLASEKESVLVPRTSIQLLYDHPCVFVWRDGGFELREVVTGASDGERVEVIRGLEAGEEVAAVNAFHLKAEYIKSVGGGLGAGHGHPH